MSKVNAQEELQKVLTDTYFANLEFLKNCDKGLYERVNALSSAINYGAYISRYEIDFIEADGEFDIYDTHTDSFLYNKKAKKYNNQAINSINFDKKGSFSCFESVIFQTGKVDDFEIDKNTIQESEQGTLKLCKDIHKYVNVFNDDTTTEKSFKFIPKFVFIGTLLGRHMPGIVKKISARNYFVHEPNLEIFRLSLFVVDYTILLFNNANVKFSIMDDEYIFEQKFYDFMSINNWENYIIKFYTTDYNIEKSFESIINAISALKPTLFNYNLLLYSVVRNMTNRINKYKFLYFPIDSPVKFLQEKPVIYVCSGPSLDDHIDWLKENQNRFTVVTIGATYKKLLAHDINPDIIITVDGSYTVLDKLQFDIQSVEKISNCIVFASSYTDQRILDRFNQDKLYLFDSMISLSKKSVAPIGYSVGEFGYQILLQLGVSEIYLLGTDLALHKEKGTSHTQNSNSNTRTYDINNLVSSVEKGTFSLQDDLIKVKGNFEEEVVTTRMLNNSLSIYNQINKDIRQTVYNLCNHGAYLRNTIPLKVEDIKLSDIGIFKNKTIVDKNFHHQLDAVSSISLDSFSIEELQKEQLLIENIIQMVEETKKIHFKDYDDFRVYFLNILIEIIKDTSDTNRPITKIVSLFCPIINMYIEYCFNDTTLKKESKKIEVVSQLWLNEMEILLKDYKRFVDKIL